MLWGICSFPLSLSFPFPENNEQSETAASLQQPGRYDALLALQKLSGLSETVLHRSFIRRSDQRTLQNSLPFQLNQCLIGLIPFSGAYVILCCKIQTSQNSMEASRMHRVWFTNLIVHPYEFLWSFMDLIGQSWSINPTAVFLCDEWFL